MEKRTLRFRLAGAVYLLCILSVSCLSTNNLTTRPLYTIDKFRIDDTILRTVFTEQLLLAKVQESASTLVLTLEMYVRLGRTIYSMNVHGVGGDLPDRDELILMIDEKIIALTAAGPSSVNPTGDKDMETLRFFLDEDAFKSLRYCEALEIHYDRHAIPIPREGCEAIWKFLKD